MVENALYNKTSVLILTIDCNHKLKGGTAEYQNKDSIFSTKIEDLNKEVLQSKRKEIFFLLKEDKIRWEKDRNELRINRELKKGQDFGFQHNEENIRFLPAIIRYRGGFYSGLEDQGRKFMADCKHHFLILTAAYGLLLPFEPIQYYGCQFGEKNDAYKLWTNKEVVSNILIDYIKKYNIKRIFDFTHCSVEAFHICFNWRLINEKTGVEILHAYHRWNEGDDALPNFGFFFRDHMLNETDSNLIDLDYNIYYGDIIFTTEIKQDSLTNSLNQFEINLRKLIHSVLDTRYQDFWVEYDKMDDSPKPLLKEITEKINAEILKNPFMKQFEQDKLDYCTIYNYKKIIEKFWTEFNPIFGSKDVLRKHIDNIVELRNPNKHVRDPNDVVVALGKASLKWFDHIFKKEGI